MLNTDDKMQKRLDGDLDFARKISLYILFLWHKNHVRTRILLDSLDAFTLLVMEGDLNECFLR